MEGYKCKVYPQSVANFAIESIMSITQKLTADGFAKKKDRLSQEEIKRLYENLETCKQAILDLVPADPV